MKTGDDSKKKLPGTDPRSPDRLFSAEEQPLEADQESLDYLKKNPEYLQYIQSVRRIEKAIRGKKKKNHR